VTHDNVLNVHEFSLVMHLIRGLLQGQPAPQTLPRKLAPPKTPTLLIQPPTEQEKQAYSSIFKALDKDSTGFLSGELFNS
jgi:hypothetical protein